MMRVVFPPRCACCGALFHPPRGRDVELSTISRGGLRTFFAPFLCKPCLGDVIPVSSPICTMCGAVFTSREGRDRVCGDCMAEPKRFGVARAAGVYDRSFRIIIHRLKFQGKTRLAAPLEKGLFRAMVRMWAPADIDVVIPMPLHEKRLRKRGFNQASLVVRNWRREADRFGGFRDSFRVDSEVLIRSRMTKPQTGLGKKQRMENIRNAFHVGDAERIGGKRILLVDDVYTTGATVNECARVLLKAGAERVDVLTLARAP